MVMRMPLEQISVLSRVTQGVRLINLKNEQSVATISLVDKEKEEEIIDETSGVVVDNNKLIETVDMLKEEVVDNDVPRETSTVENVNN